MKKLAATLALCPLFLFATPAFAQKSCDELKSNIAAKLESKNVKNYQLEIVAADEAKDAKVVGTCEHGKKKITYKKS
ncbi:MAG: hypothetical protein QG592_2048 [Pseudomonadota bacterium]|nr:hypothetical protein [Pseudomonadota bacterium]MDQ5941267.1 hypothetical protein [Pseudomonadota bacterium]MDQ5960965.1 hypothetical protein [Pseudomonadota bacterium]